MINQNNDQSLNLDPPSREIDCDDVKYRLKNETVYRVVDHAVGAIALECGYQVAHQSSLDILTDICCDYMKKVATLLRTAHETEDSRDTNSDFVDSLERVFHQINIPSAANLHQFVCKMQAIRRHQLKQQAQQILNITTPTAEDH